MKPIKKILMFFFDSKRHTIAKNERDAIYCPSDFQADVLSVKDVTYVPSSLADVMT